MIKIDRIFLIIMCSFAPIRHVPCRRRSARLQSVSNSRGMSHFRSFGCLQCCRRERKNMLRRILGALVVVLCFTFTSLDAIAQEVVHALTGTIKSIDPDRKTITIFTDKGSEDTFHCLTNLQTKLVFDKKI